MNGDPYARGQQPADRRVINRAGAAATQRPDEPQPVREEAPRTAPRSSKPYRDDYDDQKKSRKGLLWTVVIIILIIVLAVAGWLVWSNAKKSATGIDPSKYQAVFLTNGQVYFGKLEYYNDEYLRLTTVYSAQAAKTGTESSDKEATSDEGVQLIRLGNEEYGPENEVFISKQQITHYENLKKDGKVTRLIDQNEKNN